MFPCCNTVTGCYKESFGGGILDLSKLNLNELSLKELLSLYYKVGWEIFKKIWWAVLILLTVVIAITIWENK